MGKEQAFCLEHIDFEVPLVNPNGNGDLDMQVQGRHPGQEQKLRVINV